MIRHTTSPDFWRCYRRLPREVQRLAVGAFQRLEQNPRHPGVRLKPVGPYWSARVGMDHRALAVKADSTFIWFWIGSHAQYDKLIDRR